MLQLKDDLLLCLEAREVRDAASAHSNAPFLVMKVVMVVLMEQPFLPLAKDEGSQSRARSVDHRQWSQQLLHQK